MTLGPGGDARGDGATGPRRPARAPALLAVLLVVAACWVTGVAAVNLLGSSSPAGAAARRIFPRFGAASVDQATIQSAWDTVGSHYWRRDITAGEGTTGAVAGIVDELRTRYGDRFSSYFSAAQFRNLQDSLGGRHSGSVGIELEARCDRGAPCAPGASPSVVAVTGVLHGQPAERAGVHRGDILVAVDGARLATLGADPDAQITAGGNRIRGDAGAVVHLTLQRAGGMTDVSVTRADLTLSAVFSQRFGTTLLVQITAFDEQVGAHLESMLRDAVSAGVTAVVLDLRHNPGGLVTEAQAVASQFLVPSPTVRDVVVRRGRIAGADPQSAQIVEHDAVQPGATAPTQRVAVLVDGDSASAAEIVAAAIRDPHRGLLVGQRTFGKGSVQEDFGLPDGSDLHLTVEKWFGPAGESIDGTGISPDRTVALTDDDHRFRLDAQAPDAAQDAQLQAALQAVATPGG